MRTLLKKLEAFMKNPWIDAFVGFVLLFTALNEVDTSILEDVTSGHIGAHHGVIVLGLVHILKSLPSVLNGLILLFCAKKT